MIFSVPASEGQQRVPAGTQSFHPVQSAAPSPLRRARVTIRGAVQGVGFRPFIWRLASDLGLPGWVNNSAQGLCLEVEGRESEINDFIRRIETEKPSHGFIQDLETTWMDVVGYQEFEIRPSDNDGSPTTLVLPDIATCPDCLGEVFDRGNRRHRYPFINCTQCGPRFSIIESLPYDRAKTSMKRFTMCADCQAEYDTPSSRRFHAQPNACPVCGPQLELWNSEGRSVAAREDALHTAIERLRQGSIVAVKGIGGFHLMVIANNDRAVRRLRKLKHREEKPFAVMLRSIPFVAEACDVSELEARLLCSPEAPITLLRRKRTSGTPPFGSTISEAVAPGNPWLGVMLAYTPLHHLLLAELDAPLVATSGNLADEPICTDEREAVERLRGIADLFLVHNRPIVRHLDDSIVRVMAGRELLLRRARGFAPLPIITGHSPDKNERMDGAARPVLALGAHQKNTVALAVNGQAFVSQHVGDLDTVQALHTFQSVIEDGERLRDLSPVMIAADLHPDYPSTRRARRSGLPIVHVQHHFAHVLSCMAEHQMEHPALGVAWDGTGYGVDGTIWGGEFLRVHDSGFERVAHLRTWRLPGGDSAMREPRRSATGLLHELFGETAFEMEELSVFRTTRFCATMLRRRINSPVTSSAGRLFDAVASMVGLRQECGFEGQAAMELEFALDGLETDDAYPLPLRDDILDWGPMVRAILDDARAGTPVGIISVRFHNALTEGIVAAAHRTGERCVVLSGGCFQNRYLTERTVQRLREEGFQPCWHQRVPPNDGGISLGQAHAALHTHLSDINHR